MNTQLFKQYIEEKLIPKIERIVKKLPSVQIVKVQMDRAPGHGGGRRNIDEILSELNAIGENKEPKIVFVAQPARSPDLNALDLGAWNSLAKGVRPIQSQNWAEISENPEVPLQRTTDRLIDHVMQSWRKWGARRILQNIFDTKQRVIRQVFEVHGSNEYSIPRSGKSHRNVTASFRPDVPDFSETEEENSSQSERTDEVSDEENDGTSSFEESDVENDDTISCEEILEEETTTDDEI